MSLEDLQVIKILKNTKIPSCYKIDETDNILFVEFVDFDICEWLLKDSKIEKNVIEKVVFDYSQFLSQISFKSFDEEAKAHFKLLIKVINIFLCKYL